MSGRIGNVVYRQLKNGETRMCKAPDFSHRKLSAPQSAQVGWFKDAVRRAKVALADPQTKAAYQKLADQEGKPLMAVAMREAMKNGP